MSKIKDSGNYRFASNIALVTSLSISIFSTLLLCLAGLFITLSLGNPSVDFNLIIYSGLIFLCSFPVTLLSGIYFILAVFKQNAPAEKRNVLKNFTVTDKKMFIPLGVERWIVKTNIFRQNRNLRYTLIDENNNHYSVNKEMYHQVNKGDYIEVKIDEAYSHNFIIELDIIKKTDTIEVKSEEDINKEELAFVNNHFDRIYLVIFIVILIVCPLLTACSWIIRFITN